MTDAGGRPSLGARLAATDSVVLLRGGIVALAGLGVVGLFIELVFLRHWSTAGALIVWPALACAAAATVGLLGSPSARRIRWIRWVAVAVAIVGVVGMGYHVAENLTAGPLDRAYASTWDGLPFVEQLFLAVTGGVGPAPALAPGSMTEVALAIVLATVRHPGLRRPNGFLERRPA